MDLLRSNYQGSSASNAALIERADGTLARRLDYIGPREQLVNSTDVAFFAQDRIQPHARWYVEFGGRLDHDGISGTTRVLRVLSDTDNVDTQGPVWLVGGKTL